MQPPSPPPIHENVLSSFHPQLIGGDNLWIAADLVYFLPSEKSIAMTNEKTDLFTTADVTKKPVVDPHFDWSLGCRLGMGYIFSARNWDMALSWLRFTSDAHQSRSTHHNIAYGIFPIWALADDILPFDWVEEAKMRWKLELNLLDLDFGRLLSWREAFFFRPFAGLRTAWINQQIDISYSGGIFANGLNLPGIGSTCRADHVDMTNRFWGIGPQIGIDPEVNLGKGFRLYGRACGSLEWSFFNVHQKETLLENRRYDRHRHPVRWRWMLDAAGGIMWKTYVASRRFALTFALGWEYHIFFHQVELKGDDFGLVSSNRDLILNGAAFSARFDF